MSYSKQGSCQSYLKNNIWSVFSLKCDPSKLCQSCRCSTCHLAVLTDGPRVQIMFSNPRKSAFKFPKLDSLGMQNGRVENPTSTLHRSDAFNRQNQFILICFEKKQNKKPTILKSNLTFIEMLERTFVVVCIYLLRRPETLVSLFSPSSSNLELKTYSCDFLTR